MWDNGSPQGKKKIRVLIYLVRSPKKKSCLFNARNKSDANCVWIRVTTYENG